jgi:hypothetical protein
MPNSLVNKVAEVCGKSKDEVEHLWSQAEDIAKKQYKLKELSGKNYAIVTGIFKKSITNDCAKKLGWLQEDLQMSFLEKLLLESRKKKEKSDKNKSKNSSSDKDMPDAKEIAQDAIETMQMDKMNITAENKLIKNIFDLISETRASINK